MKTIAYVLTALLLCSSLAVAEADVHHKARPASTETVRSRAECRLDGYIDFSDAPNAAIPDYDPDGVWIGPLSTDPGFLIQDVVLSLDIQHWYIGDLIVTLHYDSDCDGAPDVAGGILCRPLLDGCAFEDCCGCGGQFDGVYAFNDAVASIEDDCGWFFESGCYGPDYDSDGLDLFDGLETGGCFWLHAIDGAEYDDGVVREWEVSILGEPVATPSSVALDILPGACPNPLNVKSNGKLPVAILGSEDFDASMIDPATVELEGVAPHKSSFGDVAAPPDGEGLCECTELGPDGYTDLVLKFQRQDIVGAMGPVANADMVELTLTGLMVDGTSFSVSDCVMILARGNSHKDEPDPTEEGDGSRGAAVEETSWGSIKARYR